jgi:hypothetical protein
MRPPTGSYGVLSFNLKTTNNIADHRKNNSKSVTASKKANHRQRENSGIMVATVFRP